MSVGLGNIWKFPALAYENGGSAFLFPYITCALVLCLPFIYAEFLIGQYNNAGPSHAFRKYALAFQGVGWAMAIMSATVCVYYTVIVAWAGVYMAWIVVGRMKEWTKCNNEWNTQYCTIPEKSLECASNDSMTPFFMGGICVNSSDSLIGAAEEFFQLRTIRKSSGFGELGGLHLDVLISLVVMWVLIALILIKGIKFMGYSVYVTSTIPYLIVIILFIRGVTLDGASEGLYWYLGNPDWARILLIETWKRAAMQVLFSIGIGFGALIALASYSKHNNNFYRDALTLIAGDTFMSVFGGMAVFSTLGYLAKSLNKPIDKVVQSGISLAFIVYPEATSRMPFPELWAFLFFFMVFALGLSSEVVCAIGMAEVLCTCIYDQFPSTRKRKWVVSLGTCILYFVLGLIMATGSGWYWFQVYHNFTATTCVVAIAALEAICLGWVYGAKNSLADIRSMLGEPTCRLSRLVGPSSWYWGIMWMSVCPIVATIFGWCLSVGPLLAVPIFLVKNVIELRREGKSLWELFRVQRDHRSYGRIQEESLMNIEKKNLTEESSISQISI